MTEQLTTVTLAQTEKRFHILDSFIATDQDRLICNHCGKSYSKKKSKHTLKKHLFQYHSDSLENDKEEEKNGSNESFSTALLDWIIDDLQPFLVVENRSFRKMISTLNKNALVPCRQTIAHMISREFEIQKALQINTFTNINSKISLTLDLWTSESDEPYIKIMVHFVDSSWNPRTNYCLYQNLIIHILEKQYVKKCWMLQTNI